MKICFQLSMPNRGSWNGRWSGEGDLYAKVVNFSNSKAGTAAANKILEHKSYYHKWDDGWGASISVRKVDGKESASIKRRSKGFCGYDWMIDNIRSHGSCYDAKSPNAGSSNGKTAGLDSSLKMTRENLGSTPRPATIKDVVDAAIESGLSPSQLVKVCEEAADKLTQ